MPDALPKTTTWLPSAADRARYDEDGYFVSPPILAGSLLDDAWTAIEAFLASDASAVDPRARLSDLRQRDGAAIDHVGYLYHELPAVRALIEGSRIAEIAAQLSGAYSIRLFHDRLLVKPATGLADAAIGWHVDRAYWFACTSDSMLTAWIPFADVDAATGSLAVIPGSHRWEDGPLLATSHRVDMEQLWAEATEGRDVTAVPLSLHRGQVSFHHCRTVHGSLTNRGAHDRPALAVHLQPGDNRRRRVVLPNGRELGHTNDLLCRTDAVGQPDYTDPAAFPVLWPIAS